MKKVLFSLFFICIFLVPALADYRVDSVAVTAEVSAKGRAQVSTVLQLTFDSTEQQVAVPLPDRDVSRVSVSDCRFSVEETDEGTDVILKKKGGFAGTQTFLVSYTVPYADDGDSDADHFALGLLSSRWARPVGGCSFQLILPRPFEAEPQITSGYYGALPPADTALTVTETSLGGTVSERMAYDSLSLELELPDQYFQVRSTKVPVISVTFLAVGMLGLWILAMLYWRLKIRSPRAESSPRLLLPEGILACQLPMVLDGSTCDVTALILEWANLGYLSISQSRQGIVMLTRLMQMGSERSKAEQRLFAQIFAHKLRVAVTPGRFSQAAARFRAASRRSLYRVIFDRTGGNPAIVKIPCQALLSLGIGYMVYQLMPEGPGFIVLASLVGILSLVYSLLLHSTVSRAAALHSATRISAVCWLLAAGLVPLSLLAGALPEVLVGLCACVFSGVATAAGPRRSARGVDAMAQARGCRIFYREASWQRLQIFQGRSGRFFQSQLPGAVALGMDRQFARRFERLSVSMPEWLKIPGDPKRSATALQRQLAPILRQLREAFR